MPRTSGNERERQERGCKKYNTPLLNYSPNPDERELIPTE
jgi:hypothetical protein